MQRGISQQHTPCLTSLGVWMRRNDPHVGSLWEIPQMGYLALGFLAEQSITDQLLNAGSSAQTRSLGVPLHVSKARSCNPSRKPELSEMQRWACFVCTGYFLGRLSCFCGFLRVLVTFGGFAFRILTITSDTLLAS